MEMKFKIVQGTVKHLEVLHQLFVHSITRTCTKDYNPAEIKAWTQSIENTERWRSKIEEQEFYLAYYQDELAGFVSLADGQYIDFLYSHPDYQGMGLASLLIQTVESRALALGAELIASDISIT